MKKELINYSFKTTFQHFLWNFGLKLRQNGSSIEKQTTSDRDFDQIFSSKPRRQKGAGTREVRVRAREDDDAGEVVLSGPCWT